MPPLKWSPQSLRDVVRLHDFLAPKSSDAAKRAVKALRQGIQGLGKHRRWVARRRAANRIPGVGRRVRQRSLCRHVPLRWERSRDPRNSSWARSGLMMPRPPSQSPDLTPPSTSTKCPKPPWSTPAVTEGSVTFSTEPASPFPKMPKICKIITKLWRTINS